MLLCNDMSRSFLSLLRQDENGTWDAKRNAKNKRDIDRNGTFGWSAQKRQHLKRRSGEETSLTFSRVPNLINLHCWAMLLETSRRWLFLCSPGSRWNIPLMPNQRRRSKRCECVRWCILKTGQMFQMILFFPSVILLLPSLSKCVDYFLCVPIDFAFYLWALNCFSVLSC